MMACLQIFHKSNNTNSFTVYNTLQLSLKYFFDTFNRRVGYSLTYGQDFDGECWLKRPLAFKRPQVYATLAALPRHIMICWYWERRNNEWLAIDSRIEKNIIHYNTLLFFYRIIYLFISIASRFLMSFSISPNHKIIRKSCLFWNLLEAFWSPRAFWGNIVLMK